MHSRAVSFTCLFLLDRRSLCLYSVSAMTSKVLLEKLPETKEIEGAKRWDEEKGEFAQIAYKEEMHHLALFTLKRGFTRGDHYHRKKDEVFYVAAGRIRAEFRDMDTGETGSMALERGHKLRIQPGVWHIFYGIEDALVVEYSPQHYDKNDAFRV